MLNYVLNIFKLNGIQYIEHICAIRHTTIGIFIRKVLLDQFVFFDFGINILDTLFIKLRYINRPEFTEL